MPVSFRKFRFRSHSGARLLRDYLEFKVVRGYSSYANGVAYTARDFDRYLTETAIAEITQLDERLMVNWIYGPPVVSDHVRNRRILFLRGFCQYLVRRGFFKHNRAEGITVLPVRYKPPYIYSLLEIHQLLQEAEKFPKRRIAFTLKTMLYLLYACGLRLNEALRLKVQDIDFEERTLALWNTKFHKERLVPFSHHTDVAMRDYLRYRRKRYHLKPTDFVFAVTKDNQRQISEAVMHRYFHLIRHQCGLTPSVTGRGPRLHDLRHAFAVHRLYKWYQEGASLLNKLPLLSTYMGHASPHDTQVYLTITESLLREGDGRFREAFEKVTMPSLKKAFQNS